MKVLLLEDDIALGDIIYCHLQDRQFNVTIVTNGENALDRLINEKFDLALLDINTPHTTGLNVLKTIREYKNQTPVIIITAYLDTSYLKNAFENGADDYIKKPFDLEELDQRIDKLCRQFFIEQDDEIIISDHIKFIPTTNQLIINDKNIKIAQKESQILQYFCKHKNRIISSNELFQNIWIYENIPTDATIRVYIKTLRELIGKDSIITLRGLGYKFEQR